MGKASSLASDADWLLTLSEAFSVILCCFKFCARGDVSVNALGDLDAMRAERRKDMAVRYHGGRGWQDI
jgi:hypothetical protein